MMEMENQGQDELPSEEMPPHMTYGGAALLLHLSYLRASWLVGQALARAFPDQDSWLKALDEPEFQETLTNFAQLLEDIQLELSATPDPELLRRFGEQHYQRSLECVEAFAERIGVSPHELLLVSVRL